MTTELHRAAFAYAMRGWAIFPCRVNGKEPACKGGFKAATHTTGQIDRWWSEADYNIGFMPEQAGLCVIDIDRKSGGLDTWTALCAKYGAPPATYTVGTPNGGLHLFFKGSLPASVGKLGPGIDTRGVGSYVLLPPSVISDLEYRPI